MIELKNVSCSFDDKTILKNINLKINNHLSILGANGSGKSTLAKAISGLIHFDGEVSINAKNLQDINLMQRAKSISYIPAKLEVYDPYINVEEFVLLGRFPHKKSFFNYSSKDEKIAQGTLEFLRIAHLKKHTLHSLSSGEQQLTLIAQALAQQSEVIIFDEPTANLDPHNSKVIAQHIKGLKDYHQIILITHDIHLASFIDSPVVFIKNQGATLHENDFFEEATLGKLYEVEFNSLVVKYD
ncbi:MAG: iron complex transport system ATP-binding protein [Sulfurimonas sp.]|uniref:ABC transporter ATP-binding protein n=1 Tax=Sulfurimonas sp. TaxID=2022749 RepID=UPI0039E69014